MDRVVAAALLAAPLTACAARPAAEAPEVEHPPVAAYAVGAQAGLSRLDTAVRRYAADHAGRLPASLDALASEPSLDGDRYVRRVDADPWGQPYAYAVTDARHGLYDLRSFGPDTLPGTGDDVVVPPRSVLPSD